MAKNPLKASAEQLIYADQLRQLRLTLRDTGKYQGDDALTALNAKAVDARTKRTAATLAADTAFRAAALPGVGGDVWRTLWQSARHYHQHAGYPGTAFPATDDGAVCLLCHQELTPEARARLAGFETFVKADTERLAAEAEEALAEAQSDFQAKRTQAIPHGSVRKKILLGSPALGTAVLRFLASARLRHQLCLKALSDANPDVTLPPLEQDPVGQLLELETATRTYAEELRKAADVDGRKVLEKDRDDIADCMALEGLWPKITAEVERLSSLALVVSCLGDTTTNAITKLGNDIADEVITPRVRDQFQNEIVRLAANRVRVEAVRAGGKYGSPHY